MKSTVRPFPVFSHSHHGLSDAFLARGVVLAQPEASRSGVRTSDGAVLIALRARDVLESVHEYRCLLWSPGLRSAPDVPTVRVIQQRERFFHCKLAAARGEAFALVTHGADDAVARDAALLGVDVELRRGEYWAVWARAQPMPSPSRARPGFAEAVVRGARPAAQRVCCA